MTIEVDHSSGESSGVPSSQGNMSPVYANTPGTLEAKQSRLTIQRQKMR